MKKILISTLLVLIFSFYSFSQVKWHSINENKSVSKFEPSLVLAQADKTVINYSIDGFYTIGVSTHKGESNIIDHPGASRLLLEGDPDLIKLSSSVIIPNESAVRVNVLNYEYVEYENIDIAPSKGNLFRNQNPDDIPFSYGEVYGEDKFYPGKLADTFDPYIVRDFRGIAVHTYPFQYNPVTKVLRVYHNIELEVVECKDSEVINPLTISRNTSHIDSEFANVYASHFINYSTLNRYTPLEEAGGILVISHGEFIEAMTPYVEWKNQSGHHTEIIDVSTIGLHPEWIKDYIYDYFMDNELTYILLVGNENHIPPFDVGSGWAAGHSDNAYTYLVGQDHYPDAFIGRFSAETIEDVETQVQRTLEYEKATNLTDGWLNHALGVARDEGGGMGHNGESDYEHMDIIRDKLLGYHYETVYREYDGDIPNTPNTTPQMITQRIEDGVSMINYCNHGSNTGWSVAGYDENHVNALTNVNKLPFIWSVACVNGNFVGRTCFAETWLRATHNGEPAGAVAVFMSTINQPWVPPMDAQDEFNDIIAGTYEDNIKRTYGGVAINGCMKMNDLNGMNGYEVTDTWVIFGDPSLKIRTDNPRTLSVAYDTEILIGDNEITVESDVMGAFVSLTVDNQIIGTGTIDDTGTVSIIFEEIMDAEKKIKIVVTGYNKIPHIGEIEIIEELLELDLQALRIIDPIDYYQCTDIIIEPKVVVRNRGENTINNFELFYQLNEEEIIQIDWEGSIESLDTDTIILQEFTLEEGDHKFMFYVANPNGEIDMNMSNDTVYKEFYVENLSIEADFDISDFNSCNAPVEIRFTNLSINANSYLWDFDDGNFSDRRSLTHVFDEVGVYNVKLIADAGDCGYSEFTKEIVIGAAPPEIDDIFICQGESAHFNVQNQGELFWYDNAELSNLLAQGQEFTTEQLSESKSYFVYSLVETEMFGAKQDTSQGVAGGYFDAEVKHGLVLNSYENAVLKSVVVYSDEAKERTITLEDANENVIQSKTLFIEEGRHRIDLNFEIPVGEEMILYASEEPNLYREGETGSWWEPATLLPYPYEVGEAISIIRSTAPGYENNFYYYFYDWKVEMLCQSPPIEVMVNVGDYAPEALFNYYYDNLTVELNNQSSNSAVYLWDFGDGNTSSEESPVHTYSEPGEYTIKLRVENGCGDDTYQESLILLNIEDNLRTNEKISIYPNPFINIINIESEIFIEEIRIIDITGKIVYQKPVQSYSHNVDLQHYNAGLYLIQIYDNQNNHYIYRLVKE